MKKVILSLIIVCCTVSACGHENQNDGQSGKNPIKRTQMNSEIEAEEMEPVADIQIVDYAKYFSDVNGCAVIYSVQDNCYAIYNETMISTEVSPYSTFKIVTVLMGLKNNVIQDENSTMKYSGTKYSVSSWNSNLNLKDAVQNSCVWYFRQLIDAVGKDEVQKELLALKYGNCDISEWEGRNLNPEKELNGFWLCSSLKISPMEQVNVMKQIFQNSGEYTEEQVKVLKSVLLFDEENGYSIYGKTGTGQHEGWYVGMAQKEKTEYYFAVYLNSNDLSQDVSGKEAREIVRKIFQEKE